MAASVNEAAKISGLKPGNISKGLCRYIDFQWYVLF